MWNFELLHSFLVPALNQGRDAVSTHKQHSQSSQISRFFGDVANRTSLAAGRASAFTLAVGVVLIWAISGPIFAFSDTWQLVINTGTTIVTFLMVFLIQSSQNRDTEAIQVKLDELIRATKGASNELLDLEEMSEEELDRQRRRYENLAQRARERLTHDVRAGTPKHEGEA